MGPPPDACPGPPSGGWPGAADTRRDAGRGLPADGVARNAPARRSPPGARPESMNLIVLVKAAILGVVEGLTEFIPVSSTGHLIVAQRWLHFTGERENAFIIFIQLGAILAVVVQYWRTFVNLALGLFNDKKAQRLLLHLVIGTIPAVVIGLPLDDWVDAHFFNPRAVALAFILGGLAIFAVESWYGRRRSHPERPLTTGQAFGVGLFQVLAVLFPGTSRSGATILGGLLLGLTRPAATEFSFFLAVPALFGASLVKLHHARHVLSGQDIPTFAVGFVVSFLVAWAVIRGLIGYVSGHTFKPFAWYRLAFGAFLLWLFWNASF